MAETSSKPSSRLPQPRMAIPRSRLPSGPSTQGTLLSKSTPDLRKLGAKPGRTQPPAAGSAHLGGVPATNVSKTSQLCTVAGRKRPAAAVNGLSSATHGGKKPLVQTETNKQAAKPRAADKKPSAPIITVGKKKPAPWDLKAKLDNANEKIARLAQERENLQHASDEANHLKEELERCSELYKISEEELSQAKKRIKQNEGLEAHAKHLKTQVETLQMKSDELKEQVNLLSMNLQKKSAETENLKCEVHILQEQLAKESQQVSNLRSELHLSQVQSQEQRQQYIDTIFELQQSRKEMHNQILDLKGNIRVVCRVRPPLESETEKKSLTFVFPDETTLEVAQDTPAGTPHNAQKHKLDKTSFTFDRVFGPDASQDDIYSELSLLVQSALDGYNVCVFAYGQTGSGKTYTMEGGNNHETEGVIPRAVRAVFKSIDEQSKLGWDFTVKCSFLEIYNENIKDLLNPNDKSVHEVKMVESGSDDIFVSNLTVKVVPNEDSLHKLFIKAQKNRFVAATFLNEQSSRSHSVTQIKLEGYNTKRKIQLQGTLNLIDLAGSEKYRIENKNDRRIETCNINKSLTSLSLVVLRLAQKAEHIPFRDSKLTHMLMPSLKGNSKTLMMVNIPPFENCFNETMNSLRFALRISDVKVQSKRQMKSGSVSGVKTVALTKPS